MLQLLDEKKKEWLIEKLIHFGIYKKGNEQLFECSLEELQAEYSRIQESRREV
jgi:hypothetical protein